MIISIGIDIIEVSRVLKVLQRTPRFIERVFTDGERAYCDARGSLKVAAKHYAARFAAKEAALKALGTGWRGGLSWQDVEILSKETGAPSINFHNVARELFRQSGANRAHLTLSHTSEHAIAQVILEQ
ncbi:MAG: holo-ACP synthase [Pyrinomonadaceae bacterium]|nr:holo-ACP synthase [Pyrinomonadaceae bacterium]